jgi:hypothetical protein
MRRGNSILKLAVLREDSDHVPDANALQGPKESIPMTRQADIAREARYSCARDMSNGQPECLFIVAFEHHSFKADSYNFDAFNRTPHVTPSRQLHGSKNPLVGSLNWACLGGEFVSLRKRGTRGLSKKFKLARRPSPPLQLRLQSDLVQISLCIAQANQAHGNGARNQK